MKRVMLLAAGAAAVLLCGCAGGPYGYGYGYGPGPDDLAYDGYYDDAYGPIYDGYWNGGAFYYRGHEGDKWRRDSGNHFRHEQAQGFHHIGGAVHGGGAHAGGGHGGRRP